MSQKSALTPGECALEDSGGYMNQPLSGATPASNAKTSINPPNT